MLQKKVCVLGAYAVGKTSLISRFVKSVFSEKYHTTVGVKIDKKEVQLESGTSRLMLWDLAGEDDFSKVRLSFLRGSSGYLLVVDPTRPDTFQVAESLREQVARSEKTLPIVVLMNKADLELEWELNHALIELWEQAGLTVLKTSAKTGANVENAFHTLVRALA